MSMNIISLSHIFGIFATLIFALAQYSHEFSFPVTKSQIVASWSNQMSPCMFCDFGEAYS